MTGLYWSPKANAHISFRSSWELAVCHHLDADPNVVSYSYETLPLPYLRKGKRVRYYYPDFLVHYKDGKTVLVEVKPESMVLNEVVQKKAQAGKAWASRNNAVYEFWTETQVLELLARYRDKIWQHKDDQKPKQTARPATDMRKVRAVKNFAKRKKKPKKK